MANHALTSGRAAIALGLIMAVAGANHFVNPQAYLGLVPPYIIEPVAGNFLAGIAEVLLGLLCLHPATRRLGAWGVFGLFVALVPAHIYFIQMGHCAGSFCVPPWVGWARLLVGQPLLMLWAWYAAR